MRDRLKQQLLRTPFERLAFLTQDIPRWLRAMRYSQYRDVILEMPRMRTAIRRILKPNSNSLDVGCHIGMVLSQCLRNAPKGQHIACEAIPFKAAALRKKFPDVTIHQCAIGNQTATTSFTIERPLTGNSGLRNPGKDPDRFEAISIDIKKIDDLLDPDWRVDFMKLVIEGAELSAMQGAERTILRHRPTIIFGSTGEILESWEHSPDDIFAFVSSLGYELHTLNGFLRFEKALDASAFNQALEKPYAAFKYVALPAT